MIDIIIKYLIITWCSVFTFPKLINFSLKPKDYIFKLIPCSIIITFIAFLVRLYFAPFNIVVTLFLVTVFNLLFYKRQLNLTSALSLLSLGMGVVFYALSTVFFSLFLYFIYFIDVGLSLSFIFGSTIVGCIQVIVNFVFFKVKRFKKGLISLEKIMKNDISLILCLLVLFLFSILYTSEINLQLTEIVLFSLFLCGISFFLWWRNHIKKVYLDNIQKRNTQILEDYLSEQKNLNSILKEENEKLSKIIHKDNKLVPAMEAAVEEILTCTSVEIQKEKSKMLLSQLKAMASERSGILSDIENSAKLIAETGVISLDASLDYLFKKAINNGINLDLSVNTDVAKFIGDVIEEIDISTLILDLVENAEIAVKEEKKRNILIVFSVENSCFSFAVYDSGNMFSSDVISNMGLRKFTTHKATGGSGIGLMTTFELLNKYNASFCIKETPHNNIYTKSVSIIFDKLRELKIYTDRDELLNIQSKRNDIKINKISYD